jgi:hypothetical protein
VEIGNPATAAPPITGSLDIINDIAPDNSAPTNPLEQMPDSFPDSGTISVPGESGAPSALLLLVLGSAVIGTLLAASRQVIAKKSL